MVGRAIRAPTAAQIAVAASRPEQRAPAGHLAHDEGADAHEGELAERHLTRVAGQQHQRQADDAEGHHHAAEVSRVVPWTLVLAKGERHDHGHDQEDARRRRATPCRRRPGAPARW